MLKDIVKKARSYRRFDQTKKITAEELLQLIDLARMSPSGGNNQTLKYVLCCSEEENEKVFQTLAWAGYLTDWDGPVEGEKPTAYIIMLRDKQLQPNMTVDEGIAAQSMFLGAVEMGYGGCFLMNVNRPQLMNVLGLDPERYAISMVIALGVPVEEVVLEDMVDGDVKYYRDENQVHHVPKRKRHEVTVKIIEKEG